MSPGTTALGLWKEAGRDACSRQPGRRQQGDLVGDPLAPGRLVVGDPVGDHRVEILAVQIDGGDHGAHLLVGDRERLDGVVGARPLVLRSEEHTSELQSLMRISYAVFCLKKKNK